MYVFGCTRAYVQRMRDLQKKRDDLDANTRDA